MSRPHDHPELVVVSPRGILTQPLPEDHDRACERIKALASIVPTDCLWYVDPPRKLIPVHPA